MDTTIIHGDTLRSVMRKVPSPVTVVTATGAGESRGITIGSFTSVSLAPPLISFNVERKAQMHDVLEQANRFAVHIPSADQFALCSHFATPDQSGAEQFRPIPHHIDKYETPILSDVVAVLRCRSYDIIVAGDHSIVLGEVVNIEEQCEGPPLLYYNRDYRSLRKNVLAA